MPFIAIPAAAFVATASVAAPAAVVVTAWAATGVGIAVTAAQNSSHTQTTTVTSQTNTSTTYVVVNSSDPPPSFVEPGVVDETCAHLWSETSAPITVTVKNTGEVKQLAKYCTKCGYTPL